MPIAAAAAINDPARQMSHAASATSMRTPIQVSGTRSAASAMPKPPGSGVIRIASRVANAIAATSTMLIPVRPAVCTTTATETSTAKAALASTNALEASR